MRFFIIVIFIVFRFYSIASGGVQQLKLETARDLSKLPITCINQEYPNKLNQVIDDSIDLMEPSILHPAFYGCFDWHSSVHGHWSIAHLISIFPELNDSDSLINLLSRNITEQKIQGEVAYFNDPVNNGFERMYGWAWLFKLSTELNRLEHPKAEELVKNLSPLVRLLSEQTVTFLPKLNYAIRAGTHTNTAFALTLAYEFALEYNDTLLRNAISSRAKFFYLNDNDCPIEWEPSGYDFLSPCLEEANLMRFVLDKEEYIGWLSTFLPDLSSPDFQLKPAEVSDRTDGHLVHLDGLNFSRAWCLKGIVKSIPEYGHLNAIANEHINHSLSNLIGDDYEGGHWLASFALRALSE